MLILGIVLNQANTYLDLAAQIPMGDFLSYTWSHTKWLLYLATSQELAVVSSILGNWRVIFLGKKLIKISGKGVLFGGFEKVSSKYQKCLKWNGDYVKKIK